MNTRTRKAVNLLSQPAFLLFFVACAFAAIVPAMAEGSRQTKAGGASAAASAAHANGSRKQVNLARHHLTMPFFSFTTGG